MESDLTLTPGLLVTIGGALGTAITVLFGLVSWGYRNCEKRNHEKGKIIVAKDKQIAALHQSLVAQDERHRSELSKLRSEYESRLVEKDARMQRYLEIWTRCSYDLSRKSTPPSGVPTGGRTSG